MKKTIFGKNKNVTRRLVLKGIGGAALGMPLLESLTPKVSAASNGSPKFAIVIATGNGVQQEGPRFSEGGGASQTEPESFWLRGGSKALTPQNMREDDDRSLSVLQNYASDINIIDGMNYKVGYNGACIHASNSCQLLTGSKVTRNGNDNRATYMSIDQRIADELNPTGIGPLTAIAGPSDGSLTSFTANGQTRTMQSNPLRNFEKVIGGDGSAGDLDALTRRNKYVNDLLREQLDTLQNDPWLSTQDRQKIEAHRDLIQDIEVQACQLESEDLKSRLDTHNSNGWHQRHDRQMQTAELHIDVMALAAACGYSYASVLQVGHWIDVGKYDLGGGTTVNNYHLVSHRVEGDNPLEVHRKMDRYMLEKTYIRLLDKLKERDLLNQGVAIWANQQANGNHLFNRVPIVLGGNAGGYLKTGQYIKKETFNTKILNTVLTATGVRKANGDPVNDFGNQDASVKTGLFNDIIA